MNGPEDLALLAAEAPIPLRALIGASGGLLLVAGARVYRYALFGSVFSLAAVGAALGLAYGATFVPALGQPAVIALGALLSGAAAAGVAKLAHRVALLAAGGVGGLALGAGVGDLIGGGAVLWGPLVGVLVGALGFPFLFQSLLKFITPLVGAVCIAFAAGRPDQLWLLGLLWGLGITIQVGLVGSRPKAGTGD